MIRVERPTDADIDLLHPMLRKAYWSPGIPRDTVARACANSLCAIARDETGALIGFARAVTDRAVFAWVCDVIIEPAHRGKGLGRGLVRALMGHPDLQTVRRWMLGTADAHGVYAELGFGPIKAPERLMEVIKPAHYKKPAA
ncbi:GNAT family N-acetyltransferase [Hyphomonas sp.]|uniref:GNAT family N-acetyltransferase n=1 Tax=Hyphomonas sp. TaxID=87 RepID=UPI0025C3B688|nr:GNAT family N-acetyltransferase [Hyphomonas sp.]